MGEKLDDLKMAQKRNRKVVITEEAIKKVPRIKYKGIPENEYDSIWKLARDVKKNSYNVGIDYDNR